MSHSETSLHRYAVLLSTMRSGSTLLKALIASAPDVAHMPEVNFQSVLRSERKRRELELRYPEERILLLKRPAWFQETGRYPSIPEGIPVQRIILLRDVYETVRSVGRMMLGKTFDRIPGVWGQKWIARHYWVPITRNLLRHGIDHPETSITVRYEQILHNPERETQAIFQFLGSEQNEGIRSYETPENFRWRWGSDDGSPRIRSKEVLPPRDLGPEDQQRKEWICSLPEVKAMREAAGYVNPAVAELCGQP
ncbi:MAG: hypothetical protein ACQKBT_05395 [Puniceicoccales bacterium]